MRGYQGSKNTELPAIQKTTPGLLMKIHRRHQNTKSHKVQTVSEFERRRQAMLRVIHSYKYLTKIPTGLELKC